MFELRMIDRHF